MASWTLPGVAHCAWIVGRLTLFSVVTDACTVAGTQHCEFASDWLQQGLVANWDDPYSNAQLNARRQTDRPRGEPPAAALTSSRRGSSPSSASSRRTS